MLTYFEEFKETLSIVNKSFLTLGKPLKLYGSSLYLRDTMLLPPVGKGRLDQLGELYNTEGDYLKRDMSYEDKNQISKFLLRDRKRFEKYAIQD
jgi:hypothetical protein